MAVMTDKINSIECITDEMTNCPDVIKFNCLARPKARKRATAGKIIIINCLLSIVCISNNHMIREKLFLPDHTIYHQDSDFMLLNFRNPSTVIQIARRSINPFTTWSSVLLAVPNLL